jgi:DNA-binding PadR family transcriptional regulator
MTYVPDSFKEEIVRRVFRNFLDVMVLRLVQREPMWGYKMIKHAQEEYSVKLRHGALYPLLSSLEKKGLLRSQKVAHGGRVRKVYEITSKGIQLIDAYNEALLTQLRNSDTQAVA